MTNNQLLDIILKLYLQDKQWALSGDPRHSRLTFAKVVKSQDPIIEDWQIMFLKEQLFADKFLQYAKYGDEEPYTLTDTGVKAAQTSWYVPLQENNEQQKTIRTETIKDFSRSRNALIISIIAIIVPTLISLYTLWLNKQQDNTEEVKQLKQQLDTIRQEQLRQQKTLHSLQAVSADTLKKAMNHK